MRMDRGQRRSLRAVRRPLVHCAILPTKGYEIRDAYCHEEVRLRGWRRSAIHADLGGIPRLYGTERHALHVVLQKQRNNQEDRRQLGPELAEFELVSMKRIRPHVAARFRVIEFVGCRDDKLPVGRQHAPRLQQELPPVAQVLDHFEGHHQIEGRVRMRQPAEFPSPILT